MKNVKKRNRFREYYDSLPAKKVEAPKMVFVQRIADITMSHPTTVKAWLYGTQKPEPIKIKLISEEMGIPAEELFD